MFKIIERLLKGVEIELPQPYSFKDKDGKLRYHIRVKWWGEAGQNYREFSFGYGSEKELFLSDAVEEHAKIPFYETGNKPVFFGHHWMTGTPCLQQDNVCCVDYSAGKGGSLVCYSLENPKDRGRLSVKNFKWSK